MSPSTFLIMAVLGAYLSLTLVPANTITAYAQENEDDDRNGFGLNEQERAREHEEGGPLLLGSGTANIVLIGTIAAIAGVGGYAGYKIYQIRRRAAGKTKAP